MKVRKTLIFPLEQPFQDTSGKHSLLYKAASWLETTMRALHEHRRETEQHRQAQRTAPIADSHLPFRRQLLPQRAFRPSRRRLPTLRRYH